MIRPDINKEIKHNQGESGNEHENPHGHLIYGLLEERIHLDLEKLQCDKHNLLLNTLKSDQSVSTRESRLSQSSYQNITMAQFQNTKTSAN